MTREEVIRKTIDTVLWTRNASDDNKNILTDALIEALEQEPKKGHWIDINHHHYYDDGDIETAELRCSCCNEEVEWDIELLHKPYYCENCGADMRGM